MEGVGARLGRSSTRYGPPTVFNGPVRKWKKRWVHVSPSSSSSSNSNSNSNNNHHSHNHHITNTLNASTSNGNNGSHHLLLYKWTPLSQRDDNHNHNSISNADNNNTNNIISSVKDDAASDHHRPTRKFKYIPVYELEKQKKEAEEKEAAENVDDEAKLSDADPDADPSAVEPDPKSDSFGEKPDINDIPMEESQSLDNNQVVRQDLNESTLDLSLGLKAHDGNSDSKPGKPRDRQLERVNTGSVGT